MESVLPSQFQLDAAASRCHTHTAGSGLDDFRHAIFIQENQVQVCKQVDMLKSFHITAETASIEIKIFKLILNIAGLEIL